jgi:hypothetical protein
LTRGRRQVSERGQTNGDDHASRFDNIAVRESQLKTGSVSVESGDKLLLYEWNQPSLESFSVSDEGVQSYRGKDIIADLSTVDAELSERCSVWYGRVRWGGEVRRPRVRL